MGKHEIISMFGATSFGALWQPISLGVTIFGIGVIFGNLFNLPVERYVPFLCVGMILWQTITSVSNECADACNGQKIDNTPYKLLLIYPIRVCFKHLFLTLLNLSVFVIVALIFSIKFSALQLAAFAFGALAFFLTILATGVMLSLLGAFFKDLSNIVRNLLNLFFFLTPIMWEPSNLEYKWVFLLNPLYHLIEAVRGPLLNWESFSLIPLVSVSLSSVLGITLAVVAWSGFAWLIPYKQ